MFKFLFSAEILAPLLLLALYIPFVIFLYIVHPGFRKYIWHRYAIKFVRDI